MRQKKVALYLIYWIKSFMLQCCCKLQVGDAEVLCSPECGLPQGSPLSPTLFLIFIEDLLMELKKSVANIQAYVDAILTWLWGNFKNGVVAPEICMAMRMVDAWSQQWRLIFNPKKCNAICFLGPQVRI